MMTDCLRLAAEWGFVDLVLIEKRRGSDDDRYVWRPFACTEGFEARWWDVPQLFGDTSTYLEVCS